VLTLQLNDNLLYRYHRQDIALFEQLAESTDASLVSCFDLGGCFGYSKLNRVGEEGESMSLATGVETFG